MTQRLDAKLTQRSASGRRDDDDERQRERRKRQQVGKQEDLLQKRSGVVTSGSWRTATQFFCVTAAMDQQQDVGDDVEKQPGEQHEPQELGQAEALQPGGHEDGGQREL